MSRDGRSHGNYEDPADRSRRSSLVGAHTSAWTTNQDFTLNNFDKVLDNLSSILNDPSQLDASTQRKADWGTWFGSIVSDVFDMGANAAPPSTDLVEDPDESLPQLLRSHPVVAERFQEYLDDIASAHQAHTTSLGFVKNIVGTTSSGRYTAEGRDEVSFLDVTFSPEKLL